MQIRRFAEAFGGLVESNNSRVKLCELSIVKRLVAAISNEHKYNY